MAKLFVQSYGESLETAIAGRATPLLTTGRLNSKIRFQNISPPGSTNKTWNIQRLKRMKAKDRNANADQRSTASALAILDSFSTQDWETLSTKSSHQRAVGLRFLPREENEYAEGSTARERLIAQSVQVRTIETEENITDAVWNTRNPQRYQLYNKNLSAWTEDDAKAALEAFKSHYLTISLKIDDFKHNSDQVVALIHPAILQQIARIAGTAYIPHGEVLENGLPIDGKLAGVPYIEDRNLNKMRFVANATQTVFCGWIMYDTEFLAVMDPMDSYDGIDQQLGNTRFVGGTYFEVFQVVDADRYTLFGFPELTAPSVGRLGESKLISA